VVILVDESFFLYVWYGNGVPTPLFLAIHPCLPATIFGQKFSSARNQIPFIDQYYVVPNNFFSTYCRPTVFLLVAFCTKNWTDENLVVDSLQIFTFPAVTWKNIVWSFSMPLWCNKHLPGQTASIIIAFEFFDMFVSTRTPSVFLWGGKLCLFSK